VLFALRVRHVKDGSTFEPVSREASLVINNLLLSIILGIVFVGTLYPKIAEAFGSTVAVGEPFFNAFTAPFAIILVLVMSLGPMLKWRRDRLKEVANRFAIPALASALTLVALLVFAPQIGILPLFGLAVAPSIALASLAPLWGRNLRRTPLFTWGMVIAHFGIAVSLAGMAADSAFTQEKLVAARAGQVIQVSNFSVRFNGVEPVVGPNWTAVRAELEASRNGGRTFLLHPDSRLFTSPVQETSEASILTFWDGQLYAAIGQPDAAGRWQFRLWWKPFVTLIWFGGILIAFGGLLSLIGRLRRERKSKPAAETEDGVEPQGATA
jgi:cytochrome c-type biogenesis protein CcmF